MWSSYLQQLRTYLTGCCVFAAATWVSHRCPDLRSWRSIPKGQGRWLEVSSVSNFETYQANRMKLRIKSKDGKEASWHIPSTAVRWHLPRILAAVLENNFDGGEASRMPKCVSHVPYTKFETIA